MNPNFLTLLIGDLALNTPNTTKQHHFIISKALINESLEFPFSIECEVMKFYKESFLKVV